jgi:copper chaperone CopZ
MDENCRVEPISKTVSADRMQNANIAVLMVWGMGCPNCAMRVRNSLLLLEGVYAAEVYLNMSMAEVLFDRKKLSTQALVEAVSSAGNDGHHEYRAEVVGM